MIEFELRELEKRVSALEEKLCEVDHRIGIRRIDDGVLIIDEPDYPPPHHGRIAEQDIIGYKAGAFDPNEPVKGDAVNTGMGNDALFNPHSDERRKENEMIFTVEVNFEIEIEAENEDEADGIARNWEPTHPQLRRYPVQQSIYVKPEYVVVMCSQENLKQE